MIGVDGAVRVLRDRPARRSVRAALLAAATLLLAVLVVAQKLDPLPEGLVATYFSDTAWSSAPILTTIDPQPSGDSMVTNANGDPPPVFSATWAGWFLTLRDGTYMFAAASDNRSSVYVDGQPVVVNAHADRSALATGSAHLARGVHAIFIQYAHDRGSFGFDLSWSREGSSLQSMGAWEFFPRHRAFGRLLVSAFVRRSWRLVAVLWGVLLLSVIAAAARPIERVTTFLRADRIHVALACVVGGSVALNLIGIWWGVPGTWAGDELTPKPVLAALWHHFSNGWFDRYPPMQFYVLNVVFSPWLLLKSSGWIHVSDNLEYATLLILARLVSIVAGAGTLVAVYFTGEDAFGKRAALLAAALTALIPLFVYYSKTANPEVPYDFWFAVSLALYVRLLGKFKTKDVVLFAVAAVLAICTKDQAYALYLPVPFVVVYCLWRSNLDAGVRRPLLAAILDRRLALAALAASALFLAIYQVPFNLAGLVSHVRDITGPGSQGYRMVEPTVAGRWSLLRLTADLDEQSLGWPLWATSMIGFAIAVTQARTRRAAVAFALVAVFYYLGFIDVILYNYDRYLLPVCVIQTLFAGVALDRLWQATTRGHRWWPRAALAGVVAYTFLYAATVDVLMVRDSRYATEQWLRAHAGVDRPMGRMFSDVVLPRLDDFETEDIGSIDELSRQAPQYFVLNADYARAVPADSPPGRLIAGLQDHKLGYQRVFRYRAEAAWPWLPAGHRDLVGPRLEPHVFSTLRTINPTMEVYERGPQ